MQTLLIVFAVIALILLVLILSVLGAIQRSLVTYLMLTIRQGNKMPQNPLNGAKTRRKKQG